MTFHDLILRLRALVTPRKIERELSDELEFHIERETRKHISPSSSGGRSSWAVSRWR